MKNRIWVLVALGLGLVPLSLRAQDDMYFIPKKKTQPEKVEEQPAKKATEQTEQTTTRELRIKSSPGYFFTFVDQEDAASERDVDEYNRRYRFSDADTNFVAEQNAVETEEDGQWVDGFDGSDEDYAYAKRILAFRSPTVGVPVSSPLYWDLCYGPNSIYWNVYDDGFYAYAFPTVWNPYYYSPWRSSFWWGFHYGYPYWDWGFGVSWGWHYPYWHHHHYWPVYSGVSYRPHPTYRTNRPSLGRTGVTRRTSGRPVQGTTVRGTSSSRTGVSRGARISTERGTQNSNRGSRVVIPRRTTERTVERTNSTFSRPVMERSTPMRSGGSSRGGGRSGVSRGAR